MRCRFSEPNLHGRKLREFAAEDEALRRRLRSRSPGPAMLLICGGARGQVLGMCSAFLLGCVLVRAGARPYLGARIVSGDEMIDGVLFPREVAAARSMEAGQRAGRWRREHCGSWPQ